MIKKKPKFKIGDKVLIRGYELPLFNLGPQPHVIYSNNGYINKIDPLCPRYNDYSYILQHNKNNDLNQVFVYEKSLERITLFKIMMLELNKRWNSERKIINKVKNII